VDVRIVAATNRDLEKSVREGSFRQDLYYRLNVVHIRTVPLREMAADIPLLASHLLARSAAELGRPEKRLSREAAARLQAHAWPGNVRELENEMKRLTLLAPGRVIREEDLSEAVRGGGTDASEASLAGTLPGAVEALERRMIAGALERTQRNQQQAARLLGLSRQGLIKKMKRYGLHPTASD
jgi:DNA-binding NtrC family response regulator